MCKTGKWFLLNELSGNGNGTDDCNDFDDSVYPGAIEVDDGIDNDCDGKIDGNAIVDVNGNIYEYLTYGNQ